MSRRALAVLVALPLAVLACERGPVTTTAPDADPAATDAGPETVDVVVRLDREFAPGPHAENKDRAAEIARDLGVEPRFTYGTALFGFAGPVPEGRLQALRQDLRVVHVERDQAVHAIAQTLPAGIDRIQVDRNATASIDGTDDAMDADIGIIDTGIDLDHPDLDVQVGKDCIDDGKSTTNDDNGHGTHVAGSAAAVDDDSHVVGAAPGARVHAVKVLDSGGSGTISSVICGVDYVTNNASTFEVANMSLGAQGTSENLRTSLQNSLDAGIYYAVAAGNDAADVYGSDGTFGTSDDFIPAAYPEVATVSAMADFDGSAGGDAGSKIFTGCGRIDDDTFAECFSNFSGSLVSDPDNPDNTTGAAIDLAAPGVSVLSTTNDGGTGRKSGTSMSSPHVAGTAALYIVQNGLSPSSASDVKAIREDLIAAGQDQSNWQSGDTKDPDSNPEPLVFATFDADSPPSVTLTNPAEGDTVSGTIDLTADASDDGSVSQVEFFVDGSSVGTDSDGSDGWSVSWDSNNVSDGDHMATAEATDDAGQTSSDSNGFTVDNQASGDTAPTIDTFDVSTRVTGPWFRADVSWAVSDADGDLTSVTTRLLDSGGNVLDEASSSVSGSDASGEHSLRTRDSSADSVRIIVTDEAGNQTTATKDVTF